MTSSIVNIDESSQKQIDQIAEQCAEIKPLVVISCITYNHEAYLRDALDGFVMQKTNFPFVAIVHDDASTDGTAAIIREYAGKYPNIILPIYETENQYSKLDGSLDRIMQEARNATGAKYIAWCEGDDYWTDPLKLQKQVNTLEANPNASACYGGFTTVGVNISPEYASACNQYLKNSHSGNLYIPLLLGNFVLTCTFICRNEVCNDSLYNECKWDLDYKIFLTAASLGNFIFLQDNVSAYRITSTGQMGSNLANVINTGEEIFLFFIKKLYSRVLETSYENKFNIFLKLWTIERKKRETYHYSTIKYLFGKSPLLLSMSGIVFFTNLLKRKIQSF